MLSDKSFKKCTQSTKYKRIIVFITNLHMLPYVHSALVMLNTFVRALLGKYEHVDRLTNMDGSGYTYFCMPSVNVQIL